MQPHKPPFFWYDKQLKSLGPFISAQPRRCPKLYFALPHYSIFCQFFSITYEKSTKNAVIENSRFPRNIDVPRYIRAKLGGSPEYWGNPGILPEYRKLSGTYRTEHPWNISPDIPRNRTKHTLIKIVIMSTVIHNVTFWAERL